MDTFTGTQPKFNIQTGNTATIALYREGSNLYYKDAAGTGHLIQSAAASTWYTIKIAVNVAMNKYDIYVDGILKASGLVH